MSPATVSMENLSRGLHQREAPCHGDSDPGDNRQPVQPVYGRTETTSLALARRRRQAAEQHGTRPGSFRHSRAEHTSCPDVSSGTWQPVWPGVLCTSSGHDVQSKDTRGPTARPVGLREALPLFQERRQFASQEPRRGVFTSRNQGNDRIPKTACGEVPAGSRVSRGSERPSPQPACRRPASVFAEDILQTICGNCF